MKTFLSLLCVAFLGLAVFVMFRANAVLKDKAFAEDMAKSQAAVSQAQAEAINSQAKAIEMQAKINEEVVRANLDRARAETFLIYTGTAAIIVAVMIAIFLVIVVIKTMKGRQQ